MSEPLTESDLQHPDREALVRFMRGDLPRYEARDVVRHLLAGCPSCRSVTGAWWPVELAAARRANKVVSFEERAAQHDYRRMFERVGRDLAAREQVFGEERRATAGLSAELTALPAAERRRMALADSRFHTWSVVDALVEESRALSTYETAGAEGLARLAIDLAERLDEDRYSAASTFDLRARAHAQLGNVLRIASRFLDAQKAMDTARELLERGSGDPVERCRFLLLQAALHGERKRYEEAEGLLERVVVLAERTGERHLAGCALVTQGRLVQQRGDVDAAVELYGRGMERVDPSQDPRMVLVASHNLVHALVDWGRYREALDRMDEVRALHHRLGGRLDRVRFRWLEGKVYQGLGWLARAAELYDEARQAFVEEELAYDAALVSLDLATVFSLQKKDAEVRRLAEEMLPIFQSRLLHQDALAALLFFHDAARHEAATLGVIYEVADYLRRAQQDPKLQFRPSGQ
ncbi:MAG TPA: hypothetical protein VHQ65_14135 [Thermoanaerobaculia bacterium]|nr:hypothetical protein [Thermoanaerobaculia bacterium]